MRPLYIDGSGGCRVVLDEPALRISVNNKADQLFPMSRISRVVCNGVVDWSMSALLACADAGISVLFLARNGELRGRWLGYGHVNQSPSQRLTDLFAKTNGEALYQNWTLSMEKLAARSFARRIGVVDWQEVSVKNLRLQLQVSLGENGRYYANLLQCVLHSELLLWLQEAGFAANDETLLNNRMDFASFMSSLLLWDFYPALLNQQYNQSEPPIQAMAHLFIHRADRCYLLFRSSINKLQQFLLSLS